MSQPIKNAAYIALDVGVRYWEDARVNNVRDEDGTLIPFRIGSRWCPVIRLSDGAFIDWPANVTARIHYKVCDEGIYHLLDANRTILATLDGYVPNCLSPEDHGYGDYVILSVNADGLISGWTVPEFYTNDGWEVA